MLLVLPSRGLPPRSRELEQLLSGARRHDGQAQARGNGKGKPPGAPRRCCRCRRCGAAAEVLQKRVAAAAAEASGDVSVCLFASLCLICLRVCVLVCPSSVLCFILSMFSFATFFFCNLSFF